MPGPLADINILEFGGIGPVPFAGSILADLGANVIFIARPGRLPDPADPQTRGRQVLELDLKHAPDVRICLAIADQCDILVEGFRPGVMERLGLGPDVVLARNPAIVYGRMTGWGQSGPLTASAGHDINYLSVTGLLNAIGPAERPSIPLNMIGDFGGGALFLLAGVLAGLHQARATGCGTVVDAAMVDGIAALASTTSHKQSIGTWNLKRESNYLDGGASRYAVYECADGKFVAFGAIEAEFYEIARQRLGLADPTFDDPFSPERWPAQREALAAHFRTRPRDEWVARCEGFDCCISPVLDFAEARGHDHAVSRRAYREFNGGTLSTIAPRFSTMEHDAPVRPFRKVSVEEISASLIKRPSENTD